MLRFFRAILLVAIAFFNWVILALLFSLFGASDAFAGWGSFLLEAALVGLAFTPFGEKYFRFINRLRCPLPDEEKVLLPAFERICSRCCLEDKPESFVVDDSFPNAFALGKCTVAVTRGLLEQAREEELEAVLAHEFGHLKNGDTKILLAAWVMNMAGSVATWIMTIFMSVLSVFNMGGAGDDQQFIGLGWFIVAISWMLRGMTWLLQKLLNMSFLAVGRAQEYEADAFAARCGYRDGLISFLSHMEPEKSRSLAAALYATHPSPEARIERLMRLA